MPVSFTAQLGGLELAAAALRRIGDPRVVTRALIRGARALEQQMRLHVSGPRPRRLDAITGELRASFDQDLSDLPRSVSVGTPLVWAEFWEVGRRGRKARPFAQPALEIVVERMPTILIEELERARDAP